MEKRNLSQNTSLFIYKNFWRKFILNWEILEIRLHVKVANNVPIPMEIQRLQSFHKNWPLQLEYCNNKIQRLSLCFEYHAMKAYGGVEL
jgi:hypothetical protein